MLCLLLTVLAHLFPAAGVGVYERTFLAVKPDGVQRRLVGEIVRRFERKGFKLVALKLVQVWQGLDVVRASRALIGATDPADAAPGTIRGDFCVEERGPRQRLGGERPPGDRALVPRRRTAVLGGQCRALAVRVAARPRGPLLLPARPGSLRGPAFLGTIK
ncbi:nucleoside diphosphate kinase 3 isoform X4 [Neovison vison]|uniref:nucleoside diphosphate kinase 3 isoform X4 n=1 Tax=Neovison vison TaxID=452646 RepID=UPI001CF097EC|nr:nucleoside diphosphate kinase 3 isoform X4 [Neogale vison]